MVYQNILFQFLPLTAICFFAVSRKAGGDSKWLLAGDPQQYFLSPLKNPACYQFYPPLALVWANYTDWLDLCCWTFK